LVMNNYSVGDHYDYLWWSEHVLMLTP